MHLLKWTFILLFITNISAQKIKVDHVIYVTKDLDSTLNKIQNLGFTIKKGSQHKNGILNAHIKFENDSSLEFITINGTPNDAQSKEYQKLISQKEGGVYVAFTGIKLNTLSTKLKKLEIQHSIETGKNWSYLTFPKNSKLAAIFFIEYHTNFKSAPTLYQHKNGVKKINTIYLEGDESTIEVLKLLEINYSDNQFSTSTGNIIVISAKNNQFRPRIIGVDFIKSTGVILKL